MFLARGLPSGFGTVRRYEALFDDVLRQILELDFLAVCQDDRALHFVLEFANDKQLQAVLVLIVLDVVLGVVAAVKVGTFAFSKVAAFLKDDVLGKVVPWFAIFAAAKFAPSVDVLGIDLNQIQTVFWAAVVVALVASLASSAADLGVNLPRAVGTGENEGPPPTPSA